MLQDLRENLKIKLKSVTKLKLSKAREEYALRNTERILSEELKSTKEETEHMTVRLSELKQEISKIKYQVAMIEICETSEKSKIENHAHMIKRHQDDFHKLFNEENQAVEQHQLKIKEREDQEKQLQQQKEKNVEEKIQFRQQELKTIEEECDAIEQECVILKKRNKAIMLKLRRKLIESEDMRQELMRREQPLEDHRALTK